jgi:hypothetical protein
MLLLLQMVGRKIAATEERNAEEEESEEVKKETPNGKNAWYKLEESPKLSKVERK